MKVIATDFFCGCFALLSTILYTGNAAHDRTSNVAMALSNAPVPVPMSPTLRPTFVWKASKNTNVVYDLLICEARAESHGYWVPGKTVQHDEGIAKTFYTLAKPLSPNTIYVWSVRARAGNRASKWSEYLDGDWSRLKQGTNADSILWPFKTPAG